MNASGTLPPRGGKGRVGGVAAEQAGESRTARSRGEGVFARETFTPRAASAALRLRKDAPLSEKALWKSLRARKLNIRRQAPFGRYIADFLHHGARLVIEVDSPRHDLDDAQLHDAERDAWMRAEGYEVIRIRDHDALGRPDEVANDIATSILTRLGKDASVPNTTASLDAAGTPPSPTLPPSRGKGEI